MIERFKNYNTPFLNQAWLIATSGGIDSMVLIDICHRLNIHFSIAHFNFMLRNKDSIQDQELVEHMAKKYNVPCYTKSCNLKQISSKDSIQMIARKLRYTWFYEIQHTHSLDYICTAHHKEDNTETILLNLIKGATTKGLGGIKHHNPYKKLVRPMLIFSKEDIKHYQTKYAIKYREDISNSDIKYQRNLLRHKVIPLLKNINPNLSETIFQNSNIIQKQNQLLENTLNAQAKSICKYINNQTLIDIKSLCNVTDPMLLLYHIMQPLGYSKTQIKNLYDNINKQPGKKFTTDIYTSLIDRTSIIISKHKTEKSLCLNVPDVDALSKIKCFSQIKIIKDISLFPKTFSRHHIYIDKDTLKFPLKIRNWKHGDKMNPLGMKGIKKISDILINLKKNQLEKSTSIVIEDANSNIVWLKDFRISEKVKMTQNTKVLLMIRID